MFENTVMLAGLGGAAVPVVIHLLGRARYRTVDWGAMMFLESATPRWRDGARVREWALLAVRMATIGLLAVALARPVAGIVASSAGSAEPARVSAVVVVDCSASMAYEDVGGSRIERAKAAALQVLSTLRRGDRACLIAAGAASQDSGGVAAATPPQLSSDLQSVAARVSELKPTPGAADLAGALSAAAALLERQQDRAAKQLFVVCDRQAASWRNADDAFVSAWASSAAARSGLQFTVIPIGGAETDNVSIESVALLNPPAVRGCAAQVKVKVHNHGATPRLGLPLTLRFGENVRGDAITTATVNLAAGEGDSVIVPVMFPSAGPAVLSAELRGGGANLDDRRDCVIDVSPPLRVLVVSEDGDAPLIRAALAPFSAVSQNGADLADVRTVAADEWSPRDSSELAAYDVIALDDVASPTAAQAAALEQFVYAGGGLLIAPGPAARTERYNQAMYHEEGGMLPALLQPAPPSSPNASPAVIDPASIDASHPMLRFMSGRTEPLDARIDRYLPVTARTPAAHVTAAYSSGDAFLIDSPYGRGRVLLVTCGLSDRWSSLPLTSFYLPLAQSAARYLAGANVPERNVNSGAELVAVFDPPVAPSPAPAAARSATVTRPDGTRDTCGIATIDRRSEARYARTDLPGLYTIQVGPRGEERRAIFSVAPPAIESDLTPLSEADWKRLAGSLGFTRVEAGEKPLAARLGGTRGGENEYWLAALAGVMGLLVIELAVTRAWSGKDDKWQGDKVARRRGEQVRTQVI
jgi:Aerotolerance regulator N-terminal/von Willebrand factor type A domain